MPRPPNSFGLHTVNHATLHRPPETKSVADQMNARRSLSMMPNAHGDRQSAIDVCIGTAEFFIAQNIFTLASRRAATARTLHRAMAALQKYFCRLA
jgi:hypothetical protein